MLEEEKADNLDSAASYLAADRDHDANRELLESGDYFQSAEVMIRLQLHSLFEMMSEVRVVILLRFQALDEYYYENNLKIFQDPGAPPPEATPGKSICVNFGKL